MTNLFVYPLKLTPPAPGVLVPRLITTIVPRILGGWMVEIRYMDKSKDDVLTGDPRLPLSPGKPCLPF